MDVFDSFATHTYRSRYWAYSHPTGLFKAPLLGEFKSFSHGCASFLFVALHHPGVILLSPAQETLAATLVSWRVPDFLSNLPV